jgi:hypothetical protein
MSKSDDSEGLNRYRHAYPSNRSWGSARDATTWHRGRPDDKTKKNENRSKSLHISRDGSSSEIPPASESSQTPSFRHGRHFAAQPPSEAKKPLFLHLMMPTYVQFSI